MSLKRTLAGLVFSGALLAGNKLYSEEPVLSLNRPVELYSSTGKRLPDNTSHLYEGDRMLLDINAFHNDGIKYLVDVYIELDGHINRNAQLIEVYPDNQTANYLINMPVESPEDPFWLGLHEFSLEAENIAGEIGNLPIGSYYLNTPIPEPSTITLLALGVTTILSKRKSKK